MNESRLSPRSAARLSAGMLFAAGGYAGLASIVMLIVRYSPLRDHIPGEAVFPLQIAILIHAVAATLLLFAARRTRRKQAVKAIVPQLIVGVLTLCSVGSLDLIVGIFYPPAVGRNSLYDRHIERGWTNRPNVYARYLQAWMRFDERGLRINEDLSDPDPPGRTRILFVGDSVTLAYNLPARAAFGWWTAKILNERLPGFDFVALNGGVCGYDTAQEYNWFANEGLALAPDLVVHQFCLNDVTGQFDPALPPTRDQHVELVLAETPRSWSGIQRAIFDIRRRLKYGRDLQAAARRIEHFELEEVLSPDPPEHVTRAWAYVLEELDRFQATAKEYDKPLLFVVFPIHEQLANLDDPGLPQQKLRAFAESKGVTYLDLLPAYRRAIEGGATAEELFKDETHPTRLGHRVAAEAIADFILHSGLLENRLPTTRATSQTP